MLLRVRVRPTLNGYSFLSKLREFDCNLPEGCAADIAQWIRRDPKRWHTITPRQLEKLVADIFRSNFTNAEVSHVGRPDDGGVDVIFVETTNKQWLIQVKRREKPNSSEPVETIRNLLGTMVLENASLGIVVSTADHFTYRAYEATGRAKKCGMIIELIDRKKLDKMLDPVLPDRPWLEVLKREAPEYARLFADKIHSDLQLKLF